MDQNSSSEPKILRQPRTFWQWLTNQEGTIFSPTPAPIVRMNPPKSALDAIETHLFNVMNELSNCDSDSEGYLALVKSMDKLHEELARRSKEESNETIPAR